MDSSRSAKAGLLAALVATVLWCHPMIAQSLGRVDSTSLRVSIIQLISSPQDYDRAKVRVAGVLLLEGDGDVLCLSEESAQYLSLMNCLNLELDHEKLGAVREEVLALNRSHVLLEGFFDAGDRGRYGLAVATVRQVARITSLETEDQTEESAETEQ